MNTGPRPRCSGGASRRGLLPEQEEDQRSTTEARIRMLAIMWREARDLAVLCERYYDRGYRRNGKYTL